MSAPAYLPLFGSDYLADTRHLTTEEHGAYLLLMIAAWRQDDCGLPLDDKKLSRIVGLSMRKWMAIRTTILEFWKVEKGRIYQPRLHKEWTYACKKSEGNRQNARKRWSSQDTENIEGASCDRMSDGNAPQPQPHNIPSNEGISPTPMENSDADKPQNEGEETVRKPSRNPVKDAELPAWLSRDDWHRWIRYRREKRRQITTDGVAFQIDALTKLYEQGHDPASVISQSINHGWIGLFEIKPEDQHNDRNRPDQRHPDEPSNPYVRASLERQAERAAGVGGQSGGWPEDG
jgi:uncharacterized protein YdaU (DUF1376 family)